MSDRGSILISTANDIGEALVEKLGGEGYAPSVWDKEYNKLGIAEVDSAPALSVLEDSSETGTARGSILLSTANAIGAMLNKKYNTDRGFKPKEWASAASKLAPLPQKSAESASICSIEDGADDVPSRSLVVTIPPTLTGISEVVENQAGKNLLNYADISTSYRVTSITENSNGSFTVVASGLGAYIDHVIKVKAGQVYSIKCTSATNDEGNATQIGAVNVYDGDNSDATLLLDGASINYSPKTFTPTGNYILVRNKITGGLGAGTGTIVEPRLNVGSTASDYVPYEEPTTYTADLGRTVYGGTADIVNGTGTDEYVILSLAVADMNNSENYPGWRNCGVREIIGAEVSSSVTDGVSTVGQYWSYNTLGSNDILYLPRGQYNNMTQSDWINTYPDLVIQFAIKKATATAFTFDGQEIPTKDGYNAFWSDQGNTALDYYAVPTPYTRGTASGAIANVQSARTDLPFTKVKANIAPNLTGVESVEVTKARVNLSSVSEYSNNPWSFWGTNFVDMLSILNMLPVGTYTLSYTFEVAEVPDTTNISYGKPFIRALINGNYVNITSYSISDASGVSVGDKFTVSASFTIDTEKAGKIENVYLYCDKKESHSGTGRGSYNLINVMLEYGSTATEYTPYEEPTVYTADLGEPVYGGYADLVSGTGLKICGKITFNGSENWSAYTTGNGYAIPLTGMERGTWYTSPLALSYPLPKVPNNDNLGVRIGVNNDGIYVVQANTIEGVTDLTSFKAWLAENPLTIIYPLDVTTEFTFDGQVISPSEGVNNLWNNAGGDTDVEYFEQE